MSYQHIINFKHF